MKELDLTKEFKIEGNKTMSVTHIRDNCFLLDNGIHRPEVVCVNMNTGESLTSCTAYKIINKPEVPAHLKRVCLAYSDWRYGQQMNDKNGDFDQWWNEVGQFDTEEVE